MSNRLGQLFQVTLFGESHGPCIGVVIDGSPAGLTIDYKAVAKDLARRRPAQSRFATGRKEDEEFEILSGVFNGKTTGAPICMIIRNKDIDSSDYEKRRFTPRPGHADYTAFVKYGGFEDYRGGGRFSARTTAGTVMAGSLAKQILEKINIRVMAHTIEIGGIRANKQTPSAILEKTESTPVRCADLAAAKQMMRALNRAVETGETLGGVIEGLGFGLPVGLGEPIFDKLDAVLAKGLFNIPAVKGVAFGSGFDAARKKGSENNDAFEFKAGKIETTTNNAGGVLGGISNGMPLSVEVAFKPIASIKTVQNTIDLRTKEPIALKNEGRFDPCPVPRAVPIVEAVMAITLADFALQAQKLPRVLK